MNGPLLRTQELNNLVAMQKVKCESAFSSCIRGWHVQQRHTYRRVCKIIECILSPVIGCRAVLINYLLNLGKIKLNFTTWRSQTKSCVI